jgi:hypothetical protein
VYDGIVNAWYSKLNAAGYHNLSVYSYTSYLNTALNSTNIRSKTRWVASYGARTGFPYSTNDRGWQYSDSGNVNGISGSVDLNAFGNKEYRADIDVRQMTSVALPNGTYYINALLKDSSSVDIPGGGAQNEIHTQLYGYNNSAAQQFTFTRQGDGSYVIANARSGKVLDVAGAAAGNKAVVWQYDADGTAAQRWFIRDSGAGYCLQSALGNWVLDINGASSGNGTPITLYAPNGSSAQKFVLASVDGTIASNSTVKITTAANSGMAVDVSGGSGENGAKIQLYPWNNSGAQLYTMKQVGNGSYLIVNAGSGKVMDVAGGSTSNGAKIQQYQSNGTNAQHWSLVKYGSGRYALISNASGKALDIPGNRITAGAALQTYAVNGTGTQQWTVTAQKTIRAELNDMAAAHRNDLDNGTHAFASAGNSSMMLDVSGGSLASGANVQLYTSNGTGAQRWSVSHDAQGYVTLTNAKSGKALDVYGASTAAGANVQQYAANGTWAQKWIAVKESGGSLSLRSALTLDRALDVSGGAMRNGANVQTYVWNGRRRSGGW